MILFYSCLATKKKVKEWYDKIKQQSTTRNESTQSSTPHYTNLPGYEADNPLLGEDFSPLQHQSQQNNVNRQYTDTTTSTTKTTPKTTLNTSNTSNARISPLRSQPVYGSYGIDVNKDTNDDDMFSSSTNNHQIKIVKDYQDQSTTDSASPYKINDDPEFLNNDNININNMNKNNKNSNSSNDNDNNNSTSSPGRYDVHKASSAGD